MLGRRCETTFNKFSRRTRRRTTTCPEPSSPARLQRFFPRSIPRILICIASTLSSCCIGSLKLPDRRGGPFHNSCRNRHCPKCQGAAAKDWLAAREADLLPVGYFHLVFTLPAEIAPIAFQNKAIVYDLLFRTAAETLLTIAADPKHLGARIGAIAVLHSWGSAMTRHPHVHMIVPGGGISLDGTRWIPCRPGFLLPVRVLSRLFRRLFLTALADAHAANRLAFFGEIVHLCRREAFDAYLAPLRRKNWFVFAKPPFAGPQAVLAYLARYTHRVAISNSRLINLDESGVTFRYKDYRRNGRARFRTMTLAPDEFIRRFLL